MHLILICVEKKEETIMTENQLKKEIKNKLKEKWGYSKHEIDVYWKVNKGLTLEELKNELEKI